MLKPFYNYLAKKLRQFFSDDSNLRVGDRFNYYIENDEGVTHLFNSLKEVSGSSTGVFSYRHPSESKSFESFTINYRDTNLIIVSNQQANEHFITLLRNKVASQEDQFQHSAILILINKELDSLQGGSESLSKKGMPLNFETFSMALKEEINNSEFSRSRKMVLMETLKKKKGENINDASSIFDLSSIVKILNSKAFASKDYPSIELFPHDELETISDERKIKNYIEDNYRWFEKVQLSIQHGDPERDLESDLSPTGLKEILAGVTDESYKTIDFSRILKWRDKGNKKHINFLNFNLEEQLGMEAWPVSDGTSKSQSRKQNLIFFNPINFFPVQFNLEFDGKFNNLNVSNGKVEVKTISKFIECTINEYAYNENFIKVECSDPNFKSNKFVFKIWVLPFSSDILHDIQDRFIINPKNGHLSFSADQKLVLNKSGDDDNAIEVKANDNLTIKETVRYKLTLNDDEEEDVIPFTINHQDTALKLEWLNQIPSVKSITGWDVWQKKRVNKKSFKFENDDGIIKLYHKGETFTVRDEFRNNLILEDTLINHGGHSWLQKENKAIEPQDLSSVLSETLINSFEDYLSHFSKNDLLPSLSFLDEEGELKARKYIEAYISELENFKEGEAIDEEKSASILKLGAVVENFEERRIKFSSVHPLVLMFQLQFNKQVDTEALSPSILKKIVPGNLLPFFNWLEPEINKIPIIYAAKDNDHTPEWQYYSKDYKFKQLASKNYIRKLVKTKIQDFTKHLKILFTYNPTAPLKINAVNLGDCKQVLQGIFDFYKETLNKGGEIEELRPIEVFIYGSGNHVTKFEEFSHYEEADVIQQEFNIDFNSKKHDIKELINQFRQKVHYYICEDLGQSEYSHLSFFQFNSHQVGNCDLSMKRLPSGKSLDGLITDVPSFFDHTAYKTGYGNKFDNSNNSFSTTITKLNALARIIGTTNPFDNNLAIGTSIKKEVRNDLKSLYKHSQWITFIDPRFDLSFFKNESSIVIIHYSDQFSNASGYDAITVTQKSKQYKSILNDFLLNQNISKEHINQDIDNLIDLFNAVNGEWLLDILSERKNENVKNEKISLVSAIKAFMAVHDHQEITWIPISLEEILRVSGGAGFSPKEGLFSTKNLGEGKEKGVHSDDILMVGLYEELENLKMFFYPIEVKIGKNPSSVEQKAKTQALKTTQLLKKYLVPKEDRFVNKLYRSFFAKLCIINSSKLELYKIWPEKKWSKISEAYRERLLNDEFIICDDLSSIIGQCGNMFFTEDTAGVLQRKLALDDDQILSFTLFKSDAYDYVLNSIPAIKSKLIDTQTTLDKKFMLSSGGFKIANKTENFQQPKKENNDYEGSQPSESLTTSTSDHKKEEPSNEIPSLTFDKVSLEERKTYYRNLLEKFKALKIEMLQKHIDEVEFIEGPAFFRMALYPAPSTTQNKIENSIKEINLVLGLSYEQSVRIFQDMGTVWLEVPKQESQSVTVSTEHIWSGFNPNEDFKIPFGVDISGDVISVDFSSSKSPHLLMAGTTGSGKSVVLDTLIRSAARFYSPNELNMFLIDPKGNELIDFEDLEHVPEDNGETSEDAIDLLNRGVEEMQRRYQLFKAQKIKVGKAAKNIQDFNVRSEEKLPRWIIVLDEYADLIEEDADNKREIESLLKRLSQKARAAGIHVILATQKPLASIVSSSIKANLPGVIALKVKTATDSRVVLDESGAETLAGNGDSLFKNGTGKVVRVQCAIHLN